MKILVIEDNLDQRNIMSHVMTNHDARWEVDCVVSGEKGLRRLQEEPYELVLLDYGLPQKNGLEVLQGIQRLSSPPPVVMVTGYGDEQVAVEAMKAGAYDYVIKDDEYWRRLPMVAQRAIEAHQLALENKRMERALQESEERLRKMVDGTQALLINVNHRGQITYVNEAAAKTLEHSPDELIGAFYLRFVHPDDRARVHNTYRKQTENKASSTSLEFRLVSATGETRWVNFLAHPLLENGQVVEQAGVALDITRRKRAKQALRESEKRYRSLFENSPLSLWVEDFSAVKVYIDDLRASGIEDFRSYFENHPESVAHCVRLVSIIDVNQATLDLFEAESRAQFLHDLDVIFIEETMPAFREELIAIAEGQKQFQVETVNQTLTGDLLHLIMKWQVAPGHENSFSRVQISFIDITERKCAEDALREAELCYRTVADFTYDWEIWEAPDGSLQYVSPSCQRVTGYPAERFINDPSLIKRIIIPADRDLWSRHRQEMDETTLPQEIQFRIRRQDGEIIWIEHACRPVEDEEGNYLGQRCSNRDITERKQAEEELKQLATALEMAPDDIAITDMEGTITYANSAFVRLHKLDSQEEAIGTNAFDWFLYPDKAIAAMHETIEKGSITHREFIMLTKHGDQFPIEISATTLKDEKGELKGFAAVSRDITERKRAKKALQRHDAILEAVSFAAERFLETSSWEKHVQDVLRRLRQTTNASRVCILQNQTAEDGTLLTSLRYEWRAPNIPSQMDNPILQALSFRDEGLTRWEDTLSQGQVIHGPTRAFPESERAILSNLDILSIVIVPIFAGTTWWGSICFEECQAEREWTMTEQDALRTAGRALGAAIKNEQVENRIHRRNRTLYQAGQEIVSSLNTEQVIVSSLEGVRKLLQAKAGSLWLIDARSGDLVCEEAVGLNGQTVKGWRLEPGQGIAGWVFDQQEGLVIPNTQDDPRHYEGVTNAIDWDVRSLLAAPLQVKGEPMGVIEVVDERPNYFNDDELNLLESLTAMIAIALENARLYNQTQRQAEDNALLLREVNHRVKNNLLAIEGMLHIEQRYMKQSQGQRRYKILLNDLINRIKGLSAVHQLLSASKWASLPLSRLLYKITSTALQTLPPDRDVQINISTTTAVKVSAQQAQNLTIIINELTTNVAKHATRPGETTHFTINADLQPDDEIIHLEFRDDGPGFPQDALHSEYQSTGLYLIRSTVRRNLHGELALHNDNGAVVTVRFAKAADGEEAAILG